MCDEEIVVDVDRDGEHFDYREFERYPHYLYPETEVLAYLTLLIAEILGLAKRRRR